MKRLLPIVAALVFTSFLAYSQISVSVDPQTFTMSGTASQTDVAYHVDVTNNGSQPVSLLWSRRVAGAPAEWWTWICDANLCYTPEVNSCPTSKPNVVAPGGTFEMIFHMNPRNVEGSGEFDLNISDMDGNILATIDGNILIGTTSTDNGTSDAKLTLFPNPTSDYFQISSLSGLKSIEVFNIVGTKVKSFDAVPQKQYFIGDLSEGMYLVRLISSSKKILKTVRMSVR
jgi:hypothetical protein